MLRKRTRPMSKEESEIFMGLCMADVAAGAPLYDDPGEGAALYSIIRKRLEWTGLNQQVTTNLILWCAYLAGGNPGKAVMWAWQLAYLSKNVYNGPISMTQWTDELPMGVPVEEVYEEVWKLQKESDGKNLLDRLVYWPGQEKGDYLMKKWGVSEDE